MNTCDVTKRVCKLGYHESAPERPIDEQWAVIKRAHEWGWRSSRLTANEFAREARSMFDEQIEYEIIQDSPTVV